MAARGCDATTRPFALFRPGNRLVGRSPDGERWDLPPGAADHPMLALVGAGLRPSSATVYRRDVEAFLAWWRDDPAHATTADVQNFLAATCPTPASWDRRRAALAHFYQAGIAAGHWTVNPAVGIPPRRRGDWRCRR